MLCLGSLYLDYRKFFIPRWILNVTVLVFLAIAFLRISPENIILPVVDVLLILIGLKFLEEKKARDYMQICILSVFLLAGSTLLTLDMIFLVYFISFIIILSPVIILISYVSEDSTIVLEVTTLWKIIAKSLTIPVVTIPLATILFIGLPRTSYPFFDFLNRPSLSTSGFSDNVRLGDVSQIQLDEAIVFRANVEPIPEHLMYWRGIVFDYFDGKSWKSGEMNRMNDHDELPAPKGRQIRYTVYLEPSVYSTLFSLDKPLFISAKSIDRYDTLTYSTRDAVVKTTRYDALSVLSEVLPDSFINRDIYLQLPGPLPEIDALVRTVTGGAGSRDALQAIASYFRSNSFTYSLEKLPITETPLQDFLFTYRYGNCEYFASAMAVMLRTAGIPARLVGGYRGGYYSDLGKYYAVPQKNAHVWVEAYVDTVGWVRYDPTPAAPDVYTSPYARGMFFTLRMMFDSIRYYWNFFVISYDLQKQFSLLSRFKQTFTDPSFSVSINKKTIAVGLISIVAAALLLLALRRFVFCRTSTDRKLIYRFENRMRQLGYDKKPSEGLEEFLERIESGATKEDAGAFIREFQQRFYRDRAIDGHDAAILRKMIRRIGSYR
jgi:transglutaminase-like putative cysteine protease